VTLFSLTKYVFVCVAN